MNSEKLKGHILILIANILFAINMPISKYLLPTHVQPESLTIMRISSACLLFWIAYLFVKREKVTMKDLGLLFVCALCGVGFNQGMYNYVQPIIASLITVMVGQDTFSFQKALSAILVFVGVYLVTQSKSREDMEKGRIR